MTPAVPDALLHFQPRSLPIPRTHPRAANDCAKATRQAELKALRSSCMLASDFAALRQAKSLDSTPGHADPITQAIQGVHATLAVRYDIVGSAMLLAPCPPLACLAPLPPLSSVTADGATDLPPSRLEQALAAFLR